MFGIIGSGSWATALAKILTDNNHQINWLVRTDAMADFISKQKHNPNYLTNAFFEPSLLNLDTSVSKIVSASDYIIIATPSAYVTDTLKGLSKRDLEGKKVISAVKGIIPEQNVLLNDYLEKEFDVLITDYFTIMGPCHAEDRKLFVKQSFSRCETLVSHLENDQVHVVIEEVAGEANVDGCFHLVSCQDPQLDTSFSEKRYGIGNTVL